MLSIALDFVFIAVWRDYKITDDLKTAIKDANLLHINLENNTDKLNLGIKKLNKLEQALNQEYYISGQHQESLIEIKERQKSANIRFIDLISSLQKVNDLLESIQLEYDISSKKYNDFHC